MSYRLGQDAGYEALHNKQSLIPLLQASYSAATTPTGEALLLGLMEVTVTALDAIQRSGVVADVPGSALANQIIDAQPQARRLLLSAALSGSPTQERANLLGALAAVIYGVRDTLTITAAEKAEPVAKETPVQRIEIVNIADTPTAMTISSLPTRTTTTEIIRNAAGNIVESLQTERDA